MLLVDDSFSCRIQRIIRWNHWKGQETRINNGPTWIIHSHTFVCFCCCYSCYNFTGKIPTKQEIFFLGTFFWLLIDVYHVYFRSIPSSYIRPPLTALPSFVFLNDRVHSFDPVQYFVCRTFVFFREFHSYIFDMQSDIHRQSIVMYWNFIDYYYWFNQWESSSQSSKDISIGLLVCFYWLTCLDGFDWWKQSNCFYRWYNFINEWECIARHSKYSRKRWDRYEVYLYF